MAAPLVSIGQLITAAEYTALAQQVNAEAARRGQTGTVPTTYSGLIRATQYNAINTLLNASPYPYTTGLANVGTGQLITAAQVNNLINAITSASNVCLCNCNYCTCNCNYCTCNCNYCTCNCNYCTCNCNYACTCNCNYSDVRLKENVKFVGIESDLNIYSWTYVWDKTTTYVGVLAQELVGTKFESALSKDSSGYYRVNYNALPVTMRKA